MPLSVSVIVPNYNHSSFLDNRIQSILDQTYQNFEVIILDDCSTDDSKQIIEKYRGHPKISHIVINTSNSGSTFIQWHKGIALSHGNLIWIAESDDVAEPTFLSTLVPLFEHPCLTLAFCRSFNINEKGFAYSLNNWPDYLNSARWHTDYINNGIDELKNFMIYRNIIPNASAAVFKKSDFLKINKGRYLNMKFSGDWMIWCELLQLGRIAYSSTPLNYFRSHDSTTRTTKPVELEIKRLKECLEVVNYICSKTDIRTDKKSNYSWVLHPFLESVLNEKEYFKLFFPPIGITNRILLYKIYGKSIYKVFDRIMHSLTNKLRFSTPNDLRY